MEKQTLSRVNMSNPRDRVRHTVVNTLRTISHVTTPFISTFLFVHLAAPVFANIGGTNLASRTMVTRFCFLQKSDWHLELFFIVVASGPGVLSNSCRRRTTSLWAYSGPCRCWNIQTPFGQLILEQVIEHSRTWIFWKTSIPLETSDQFTESLRLRDDLRLPPCPRSCP